MEIEKPSLTLTPELETAPSPTSPAETAPAPQEISKEEIPLTPEEKAMVESFSKQIDIKNTAMVMQYGAGTQQKMASFSEKALDSVRTKELGEVGDMLTNIVKELNSFDAADDDKGGIFKLFRKGADKIETLKGKYSKAAANIDSVVQSLERHQIQLMKDISGLDQLYESNLVYYKELTMYILAGKKSLEEFKASELCAARDKAAASRLPEDAQAAKDLSDMAERFEKKLHDLELTRMIAIQTAPQIRLIQSNDTAMAEKIQSTITNTIPLWKSRMVIALGIAHASEAAKAQRAVTDMTNELLKKNAQLLKQASADTARETERGIVDIETLAETNQTLISTLDEVLAIQDEGRRKRHDAEAELARMESELKDKLLALSR